MFKLTTIGLGFLGAGCLLFFMKLLSYVTKNDLQIFTIEEIAGLKWLDTISNEKIQDIFYFLSTTQLFAILFILGLIMLCLSMFKKI